MLWGAGLWVGVLMAAGAGEGAGDGAAIPAEAPAAEAAPTWVIRPFIGISNLAFNDTVDGVETSYAPNPPMKVGLALAYKGLGGALSIGAGAVETETDLPESKAIDFSVFWQGERWAVDVFVQHYEGLYGELDGEDCGEIDCPLFPDATTQRLGASVTYVWDEAFSLRTAFGQAPGKPVSAGSWLLLLGADHARLTLPVAGQPTRTAQLTGVTAGGGYGHRWVSDGGWNFAFALQAGLGPLWLDDSAGGASGLLLGTKVNLKASGGYDAGGWFTGLLALGDAIGSVGEEDEASGGETDRTWQSLYVELFYGLRY